MSFNMDSYNQNVKSRSGNRYKHLNRRITCKDLGQGDCEGWLWIKKFSVLNNKFVRRWCILHLNSLYFYRHTENDKAEGIIYIQEFRICPCESFKLKDFYFVIYNDFVSFTFAVERQSEFSKWLNKLQLSASNVNLQSCDGRIAGFTSPYLLNDVSISSNSETCSLSNETDTDLTLGFSESEDSDEECSKSPDPSYESSSESNNYNIGRTTISMRSAEPIANLNRTSEELSEASMNAIWRISEIDKLLFEKRKLLNKINSFLKGHLNSDKIQQFWEDHKTEISIPLEANITNTFSFVTE